MPRPPRLSSCLSLLTLSLPPTLTAPIPTSPCRFWYRSNVQQPSESPFTRGSEKQQHRISEHKAASAAASGPAHVHMAGTHTLHRHKHRCVCMCAHTCPDGHSAQTGKHGRGVSMSCWKPLRRSGDFPALRPETPTGPAPEHVPLTSSPGAPVTGAITLLPSPRQKDRDLCQVDAAS